MKRALKVVLVTVTAIAWLLGALTAILYWLDPRLSEGYAQKWVNPVAIGLALTLFLDLLVDVIDNRAKQKRL